MKRAVSTTLALAMALAIGATAMVTAGMAHEPKPRKWRKSESQRTYVKPKPSRKVETMEDIDANGYDPACNYCGFPSWARSALSPKDGGGAGRD